MLKRPYVTRVDVPKRPTLTLPVPRFRENRKITYGPTVKGYQKWASCSGPTDWSPIASLDDSYPDLNGRDEFMFDYVTPRFHKRREEGEVFTNPLSQKIVTVETKTTGTWSQKHSGTNCSGTTRYHEFKHDRFAILSSIPTEATQHYARWPKEFQLISTNDKNRMQRVASTGCLNQRGRSDTEIWETLAELDKTLQLLRGPVSQLNDLSARMYRSIATNQKARGLVREISADYLLYRYGISPLLKDIREILKVFEKTLGRQRKTSRGYENQFLEKTTSGYTIAGRCKYDYVILTQHNYIVRASSLDEVDLSFLNNLGFTSKGLFALPWELTSYSFVADWLGNIGDFIGATLPTFGVKNLGSCLTITEVVTNTYSVTSGQDPNPGPSAINWSYTGNAAGTISVVSQYKTRIPGLTAPTVDIRSDFKFDRFTRAADAFALIAARFTKIKNLLGPAPVRKPTYNQRKNFSLWLTQPGVR